MHVDGTGKGVLAEQNALRTAQYLHLLEVEQPGANLPPLGELDTVDVNAERLLERLLRAGPDASHNKVGGDGIFRGH